MLTPGAREYESQRQELYPLAGGVHAIFQMAIDSCVKSAVRADNRVEGTSKLFYKPHKGLYTLTTAVPFGFLRSWIGFSDGACCSLTLLTAGLHDLPALYGSRVRRTKIDGTLSGFKSGTTGLYYGVKDGVAGLVTTPMRGHEKNVSGLGGTLLTAGMGGGYLRHGTGVS